MQLLRKVRAVKDLSFLDAFGEALLGAALDECTIAELQTGSTPEYIRMTRREAGAIRRTIFKKLGTGYSAGAGNEVKALLGMDIVEDEKDSLMERAIR